MVMSNYFNITESLIPDMEIENLTIKALHEHRRLVSVADNAYFEFENSVNKLSTCDKNISEKRYKYAHAMIMLNMQQEKLNNLLNKLGYIPNIT